MAEVVGLVASIITLVEITAKASELALKAGKLARRYKHAHEEMQVLESELQDLRTVFARISSFCEKARDA